MDWLRGASIVWHPYEQTNGGSCRALLYLRLNYQGKTIPPQRFILDSGAVRTVLPEEYAIDLLDLGQYPQEKTGLRDVHGKELKGIRVPLELEIEGLLPAEHFLLRETVWFCAGIKSGLLGQASVFEQLGVIFQNFPDATEGRRFGLYRRPGSMKSPSFHTPGAWIHEGPGTFSFVDHEFLVLDGGPALYWYTGEEFADFDLAVDWYTESPEGTAGVCLRLPATIAGQPPSSRTGIEIPIEAQGSDATWRKASYPLGAWNTLTVQARGREVRILLNDMAVRTLEASAHESRTGFIGLRNHSGSRTVFRAPRLQRR